MKNLIFFLLISLTSTTCFCQNNTPSWNWAISNGGSDDEFSTAITTDVAGYTYVAGRFKSDPFNFGTSSFNNNGNNDVFISKLDFNGNVIWVKTAGSTMHEYPYDIITDNNGNVYLSGSFSSPTLSFGTTTLVNDSLISGFIVKYDTFGNVIWAKKAGNGAFGVATNSLGQVYVTGGFTDSVTTFGATTLYNAGYNDIYIVKYDVTGNVIWAKAIGSTASEYGMKVNVDNNDNVYISGEFYGSSLMFGSTILPYSGGSDVFTAKYDNLGNFIWAKSFGSNANEAFYNSTIDNNGNLYLVGDFYGNILNVGSITLTSAGQNDVFLIKYDSLGNVIWAKSGGGSHYDYVRGITTDANNNVYIAGYFGSTTIYFDTVSLFYDGYYNNFITKYNTNGSVIWAKYANANFTGDLSSDMAGNIYLCGTLRADSAKFDSQTIYNTTTNWKADIFIAKLGSNLLNVSENIYEKEETLTVYPNPFSDVLTVNYELTNKPVTIEVYNLIGKKVINQTLIQQKTVLDLSKQSNGIYFITINDGNKRISKKVIKSN